MSKSKIETIDVPNYIQWAANLRLCLHYSLEDSEFVQKGGQITYLMDPTVISLFLRPTAKAGGVAAFERDGTVNTDLVAAAVITAEFLFSHQLPGQRGSTALLAPSHSDELADMASSIQRTYDRREDKLELGTSVVQSIREKLRSIVEDDTGTQEWSGERVLRYLRQLAPQLAHYLSEGPVTEFAQLVRIYEEDLLRPLALHPAATTDILWLGSEVDYLIEDFTKRLIYKRSRRAEGLGWWSDASRRNAVRDAEALVQTILLDTASVETGGATRYLFITADRTLHDAYADWFYAAHSAAYGRSRFVMRSTAQYTPAFHLVGDTDGLGISDVTHRARIALDTLLSVAGPLDPESLMRRASPWRFDGLESASPSAYVDLSRVKLNDLKAVRDIEEEWRNVLRNSLVLNSALASRRGRAELSEVSALMKVLMQDGTDFRGAILEHQRRLIAQIEELHRSLWLAESAGQ